MIHSIAILKWKENLIKQTAQFVSKPWTQDVLKCRDNYRKIGKCYTGMNLCILFDLKQYEKFNNKITLIIKHLYLCLVNVI